MVLPVLCFRSSCVFYVGENMRQIFIIFILATVGCSPVVAAKSVKPFVKEGHMVVYKKQGTFEDTVDLVRTAITGKGLVINTVSHIGDMLKRTGKDLGTKEVIYEHAESLEFCHATISRNSMKASPYNIVFCPYIISVYSLPADPKTSYILYRRPHIAGSKQSKKTLQAIENLLDGIVQEALAW
jgi:uncharacterized protein (DUF302 family)